MAAAVAQRGADHRGYTIGLSLTAAALKQIALQLPVMLLMAVLLLAYCAGIAYIVSKFSGMGFKRR